MAKNTLSNKIEMLKPYKVGDIVEGTVVGTGRSAVFLDLGPQGTGIIYGREFLEEKNMLKSLKGGDKVVGKIIDLENEDGYSELSVKEAGRELTWKKLKQKKETQEIMKVKILGANKGGLLAELYGIQAFLPVSQLSQEHYPKVEAGDPVKIFKALQGFMGKELEAGVLDLDPKEEKVILSERLKQQHQIKEMLARYKIGDVVEGEVTGLAEFGAFMKFPLSLQIQTNESQSSSLAKEEKQSVKEIFGEVEEKYIEGLIHISEIEWQIVQNPSQFLKTGDKVTAKIIDISNGRVSLSLKALKEDPWKPIEKKYKKFDTVQGKVTKLNSFGVFVEVEAKIQGLCHISEFGTKRKMEETLTVGKTYPFQILEINIGEHRMSLRLGAEILTPNNDIVPEPAKSEQPQASQEKALNENSSPLHDEE